MRSRDIRATTAGLLLITATAAILTSSALLGSLLDGSDVLTSVAAHQERLLTASMFQLVAAFASASIAVAFYPVLRRHQAATALGSVTFRVMEGMFYALSAVGTMVLVTLSDTSLPAASAGPVADLVRDMRDSFSIAGILAFYVGGTLYYLVFFRTGLIPRWLAGWGLVGTALGFVAAVLLLFRLIDVMSTTQVVLNIPIGVQEMVLAVWLIVKGFRPMPSEPVPPLPAAEPALAAPRS
jgi:Domain of unknown function (DUF4386)